MKISAGQTEKAKGGGTGLIVGIVCSIVVILILIGVIVFLVLGKKPAKEETAEEVQEKRSVVTAENAEEVVEDLLSVPQGPQIIPQYYTVTQNSDWHFPDGSSPTFDAYVENVKDNPTPVYFNVIVDETGEIVYSSPVLALGASLEGFSLNTPLPAGEYVCTVEYHLVDEDQNELTTVNAGINLIVEK